MNRSVLHGYMSLEHSGSDCRTCTILGSSAQSWMGSIDSEMDFVSVKDSWIETLRPTETPTRWRLGFLALRSAVAHPSLAKSPPLPQPNETFHPRHVLEYDSTIPLVHLQASTNPQRSSRSADSPSPCGTKPAFAADAFRVNRDLIRCRFVFGGVGTPLPKLKTMADVFTVIRDATRGTWIVLPLSRFCLTRPSDCPLSAVRYLFGKNYVHRGISSGNMIQYETPDGEKSGLLIDLEYAKKFDDLVPHPEGITVRISSGW